MGETFPIYYETAGNMEDPCIILINGIGGQLIDWQPALIKGLVDNGFFVVLFDHRDTGLSKHYDELGVPNFNEVMQGKIIKPGYTLEDLAEDVVALMDELHIDKAHIVGASMGGIVAQYVALNSPKRVRSLTCIATTSGEPGLPEARQEVLDFFASSMSGGEQTMEAAIDKKLQLFKIYQHPDYFDEQKIREQFVKAFERGHYPDGFKRLLFAMICAQPRTERLKTLRMPCLVIHGDYDPVFPLEHGKQLAAVIPGSHLAIIEKMGHGLHEDFCPRIVDLITKFLK